MPYHTSEPSGYRQSALLNRSAAGFREEQSYEHGHGIENGDENGNENENDDENEYNNPQKRRKLQGWLEWRATSARSNDVRVGDDGIIRTVSEDERERNGSVAGSGTGTGTGIDTGEQSPWTQTVWHSSLPPRPREESVARPMQKRKLSWEGSEQGTVPGSGDVYSTASALDRGSISGSGQNTPAERNRGMDPYEHVHPSRIENIGFDDDVAPWTSDSPEERQQVVSEHENINDEDGRKEMTDNNSTDPNAGCNTTSQFTFRMRPHDCKSQSPYGAENCVDFTARVVSLRQREVLLEISERSILGIRTQVMQVNYMDLRF